MGDPPGFLSGLGQVYIDASREDATHLAECVTAIGGNVRIGTIASGDQFIHSTAQKERLVREFGAISCEMEGGSIGHVCRVNDTPFCVVRAISDGADDASAMDYPTFAKMAAEQSVRVVRRFLSEQ